MYKTNVINKFKIYHCIDFLTLIICCKVINNQKVILISVIELKDQTYYCKY